MQTSTEMEIASEEDDSGSQAKDVPLDDAESDDEELEDDLGP